MLSEYYSYWLLQTLAMLLTALVLPGLRITSIFGALITVLLLAFVNATFWDAALFFQLPAAFSLHSIVLLLSNGLLFWVLLKIVPGIEMRGVLVSLVAPIVFTMFSLLINEHAKYIDWSHLISSTLSGLGDFRDALLRGEL